MKINYRQFAIAIVHFIVFLFLTSLVLGSETPFLFTGKDFSGGAAEKYGSSHFNQNEVNFVYAKSNGSLSSMETVFTVQNVPSETRYLVLEARHDERSSAVPIEIRLNDRLLFSGPDEFGNRFWKNRSYEIPQNVLMRGENTLRIANLEPAGDPGMPPWFMVSRAAIAPQGYRLENNLLKPVDFHVQIPEKKLEMPTPLKEGEQPGFPLRGIKGWNWTPEQYLEEIPYLAKYKMNFLMNCYVSNFDTDNNWVNRWWEPLPEKLQKGYIEIIKKCKENDITFCFAVHPQLASPRPLNPKNAKDIEDYFHHFKWAQEQGARWFSISLDDVSWGTAGPAAGGREHAHLVNIIFERLRKIDSGTQMIFCPVPYWGYGTKKEDREYLEALAENMHEDVYVFWTGNQVEPTRMTSAAARSYKDIVKHRLIIWENYPVNDANPTMHLGPVSGRDRDLCNIADGYMSNSMCQQNRINRIPLLTCADYAWNPTDYDPARSIGQSILAHSETDQQAAVLKKLVEAYPGTINRYPDCPTYKVSVNPFLIECQTLLIMDKPEEIDSVILSLESLRKELETAFPGMYPSTLNTIRENIDTMKEMKSE